MNESFKPRDHLFGLALAGGYVMWLLRTARTLGFARDEGFYFRAASDYARWFSLLFSEPMRAVQQASIDPIWTSNHEHPALMKSLFALSWMFLHEKHHVFTDASTAFRFPGMLMSGLAVYVTYLFAARLFSVRAGIVAGALLALMPNVFYHAHLACFDAPIMAMWAACIYVYWRSVVRGGLGSAILAGVMFGLTLETKHNAWILPAVFVPHALIVLWPKLREPLRQGILPIPANLLAMATIGPLVFYTLWPWIWNDTIPRLQEYVNFHVHHEYYNMEFLGKNYYGPPSPPLYAPIMIAATVPAITLVLFAGGFLASLRAVLTRLRDLIVSEWRRVPPRANGAEAELLLLLAFVMPLAPFFLPKTPIFGGTKHWMTAYPFLAVFAGKAFEVAARWLEHLLAHRPARMQKLAFAGFSIAVLAAPVAVTAHSHPFGLSAYTPLVGGTAGGADLGLNRQFWGFTTQSLAPYFERAPRNASVFIHDTAWDSWARMLDERRLRPDLRAVGAPHDAMYSIVHHELHMAEVDYAAWVAYGHVAPDFVLTHDGVPIVSVYKR